MTNWGVLGLGRMGNSFANAINEVSDSKLVSIGSKSGKSYKNIKISAYEDVIKNENIDSIYISTLNNTHIDLINQCLDSKKNILCEKPVSMTLKDLNDFKNKLLKKETGFYEAIAYYSHPQTLEVLKIIQNNEIGEIKKIESNFGFSAKFNANSRLFNKNLGGGAIFDLGCYPISFAMLFSKNPTEIKILKKELKFSNSKVDEDAKATLICDDNYECNIHVSIKNNLKNICKIHGTKGHINILNPWLPGKTSQIEISSDNHFYVKIIEADLSIYANQIKNVSYAFSKKNDKQLNLFDINKSLINMNLIENWLQN